MKTLYRTAAATLLASAAAVSISSASSAQHFTSNVIVEASLCVGFDCTVGMSFGFDTIVLKENNLRLLFDDTSTSASFPNNDWRITANSSSNGGGNFLSFDDATAGRAVFRIEAGAPSSSLYVEDDGDIGVGTSSPIADIHVKTGNTPTLRLAQDGSSGFTQQVWDVAGNEANFFVRDATNGSTLPFRIRPGASSSALDIAASDNIGLLESSPDDRVHMTETTDRIFGMRYEHTGGGTNNTATVWRTVVDARSDRDYFQITRNGTGTAELQIQSNGDVSIPGTLTTGGGTCGGGCDLVFTDGFDLPSIEEHADSMWANGYLPNVGPTIENEPINVSDKLGRMLNELETAHIYIEELHTRLEALEARAAEEG